MFGHSITINTVSIPVGAIEAYLSMAKDRLLGRFNSSRCD